MVDREVLLFGDTVLSMSICYLQWLRRYSSGGTAGVLKSPWLLVQRTVSMIHRLAKWSLRLDWIGPMPCPVLSCPEHGSTTPHHTTP